ncbi:diaminobutyrate--2-oxoglutarate transaminase [Actinokineospora xionganensis]|uniref:Diaminobutyrate--2-oxoglutarate transaminase n=1 Tax=Actinokineospora xionganensis TaxID=2684470 RepID=A0ABR7LC66_9PSEU|nr:diaminobutyrate--2-oxoglutarate transaminase [Actinokineospora xionganensis]MBC6450162.1 diaminobutyrate--2-oxoglutarate transaminase [Actinokineospora xionganensis]
MTIAPHRMEPVRATTTAVFEDLESEVRSYCRKFPVVFDRAKGAELYSEDGRRYIDFFCGAGTLNYGHNNDFIKRRLVDYLAADGVVHGLDMYTVAKREFLTAFNETVLRPRELDYKVQFCGPTGTDAVEAALKLARKVTGRTGLMAFTGAYHGMSRGSLGVTGSRRARRAGGISGQDVTFVPYEDGPQGTFDSIGFIERLLSDPSSGVDIPAAVIVEPMQMEGGMYPASAEWLRALRAVTERHGVLLILDEIQAGCGRTGKFFCFEHAGIVPDIVTVSKSIGGYGLPLSMTLFRRELDVWEPAEHTGTFRGNQLAFVAATAACDLWEQTKFRTDLAVAARRLERFGAEIAATEPGVEVRGRGMALGIDLAGAGGPERAHRVQRYAFDHGVIVELCGRHDEVLKILPPLIIDIARLEVGLGVVGTALRTTLYAG